MSSLRKLAVVSAMSAIAAGTGAVCAADSVNVGFDNAADLAKFSVAGNASVDAAKARAGGASLKLPPRAGAELKLSATDVAGKVEFYVFEDMSMPADPKGRRTGPRWGVKQADGRVLVVGNLYAPYLGGDTNYTVSENPDGTPGAWFNSLTYLGESRRSAGWHKWTFDFDANKGLAISYDGVNVNAQKMRFDWNAKSSMKGFASVVFFGDDVEGGGQTIWIDDLSATAAGAMKIAPVPPPPPKPAEPVVPAKDPPAAQVTRLAYQNLGEHPRLLFTKSDIPRMRRFVEDTDEGKKLFESLADYRKYSRPSSDVNFQKDATDGQRKGLWQLPTVAMHYVLTGDKQSLEDVKGFLAHFAKTDPWESGNELDSGMSSANICIGAALAFDWCYNDLDPAFREEFRKLLWEKARRQYHGGHMMKNPDHHYWQGDPQNNHRWHRNAGMVLCALAAARGAPEEQWLLGKIADEIAFIAKWLPEDGTSHESASYLTFGGPHLVLSVQAADRGFGTKHMQAPFFKNVGAFRIHSLLPGLQDGFSYGDGAGLHFYNAFLFAGAGLNKQSALTGALLQWREAAPRAFLYAWMDILWRDPAVKPGKITEFPTAGLFADIGTLFIRDSWKDDAVGAMFRCGPMGGYLLNKYRNENDYKYINVAHDDPDANSFVIVKGAASLAETDRYSTRKKSANHNTILVNGLGQENVGRAEGGQWSQPATGKNDMTGQAILTAYKNTPAVTAIEGEAAGSYLAKNGVRPALEKFRRLLIWNTGKYILVIDDIRAPEKVKIDWLMQGPDLVAVDETAGKYKLISGAETCAFQVASDAAFLTKLQTSTADDHGKVMGHKQLVATADASKLRFTSIYSPWGGDHTLKVDWTATGAKISVLKNGVELDIWQWESAKGKLTPSTLRQVKGGAFELTAADKAPAP